jgi:D-threo-aldose 1-dehydrogenase
MNFPKVVFGTSSLGNLFGDIGYEAKVRIIRTILEAFPGQTVMFDSAGKYGAGLSLEMLGKILQELGADRNRILISNKLGWKRIPLDAVLKVPTFEGSPCIWEGIGHDAVQDISYDGVLACFNQGNELLGSVAEVVSIHDPEEYIEAGGDEPGRGKRKQDVLDAYRALFELKERGIVKHIGVGSKSIEVIEDICSEVQLDWVMTACSFTIYRHPLRTREVLKKLHGEGVKIINAAVFNSGFLIGGEYFDYVKVDEASAPELFEWRRNFHAVCDEFNVAPVSACIQFPFLFGDGCVGSVALNPGSVDHIRQYADIAAALDESGTQVQVPPGRCAAIPTEFWSKLKDFKLISL